ncbi:L,D-transpeptidase family protein [Bdellovibrio sp. HCB290]|uniref:L,D-transpeptidase family protein n=1 Tax=Bdellovibrio sp. HCB290 TaxID=3394356 RepID=UPI0039B5F99B
MKTLSILVSILVTVSGGLAHSASDSYCDDITRLDHLPRLNSEQFKNFFIDGTKVDRIVISKDRKKLYALRSDVVLKIYDVAFGGAPYGHKQFEGDNKTPEGTYTIDSKNPESLFYRGLHISYPNKADRAYAKSKGKSAGGDIMIHGFPNDPTKNALVTAVHPFYNWTSGCIAVTNLEIEQLYMMTGKGTTVEICKMSAPPQTPYPVPPPQDPNPPAEDVEQ